MPRIAAGWRLKRRRNNPYWHVYFTLNGEEIKRSTGVLLADEQAARREAAQRLSSAKPKVDDRPDAEVLSFPPNSPSSST
jgi:hypothetical protein